MNNAKVLHMKVSYNPSILSKDKQQRKGKRKGLLNVHHVQLNN